MRIDPDDVILPIDEDWSIIQWKGHGHPANAWRSTVYYDILHCDKSLATGHDKIRSTCPCGEAVPEEVQGFLVLCRNRN